MLHRSKPRSEPMGRGKVEDIYIYISPQKKHATKIGATFGDDNDVRDVGDGNYQEKTVYST